MKRRLGLTLVEVMVSLALLSSLGLTLGSSLLVMQRGAVDTLARVDLDLDQRRALGMLRRELRQSGWQGGTDQIFSPAADGKGRATLTFKMRVGLEDGDWSSDISYRLVSDGAFVRIAGTPARYRIERVQDGLAVGVVRNVSALSFSRAEGSDTVQVQLTLLMPDPTWVGPGLPDPVSVTVTDLIGVRNGAVD